MLWTEDVIENNNINFSIFHNEKYQRENCIKSDIWSAVILLVSITLFCYHCTENHIFFFRTPWKDGLTKKIALEDDLSLIIGKDDNSFFRKYDLTPWTENERWSFLKNIWKYDIFFRLSVKMVFPKRTAPAHDLSCIIWKDGIFSRKHDLFSSCRKWKTPCPRKYMETWCIAQRRKAGNLIYRVEAWLLLKFIRLEIFYNE